MCNGQCCARFCIGWNTLDDLRRMVAAGEGDPELPVIVDMLIPLPTEPEDAPRFTCKHWTGRLCRIYENRPLMCKMFPYRDRCMICGDPGPEYHLTIPPADNLYQLG